MGFEVVLDEMRELAEAFYAAGATKVHVEYGELEGSGVQVGGALVVELPDEPSTRAAIFAKYRATAATFEIDPEPDVKQSCVYVALD